MTNESTLHMLLQIKNILFSLTFFITEKENHKRKIAEKEGKIIPILGWIHDWEKDDEITKIAKKLGNELGEATDKFISDMFEIVNKKSDEREKQ